MSLPAELKHEIGRVRNLLSQLPGGGYCDDKIRVRIQEESVGRLYRVDIMPGRADEGVWIDNLIELEEFHPGLWIEHLATVVSRMAAKENERRKAREAEEAAKEEARWTPADDDALFPDLISKRPKRAIPHLDAVGIDPKTRQGPIIGKIETQK